MIERKRNSSWIWWTLGGVLVVGLVGGYIVYREAFSNQVSANEHETGHEDIKPNILRVKVETPEPGGTEKTSEQPCTVQAFETVQVFAEVSGYLKSQSVDIGSKVKRDSKTPLVVIAVPDLEKTVQRNEAAWKQYLAKVDQMKAQVKVAKAEAEAAKAAEVQAAAAAKSAEAGSLSQPATESHA